MEQTNLKENKMGSMPLPKLIFSMSLPAIFSMLIQSLYNLSLIHIWKSICK